MMPPLPDPGNHEFFWGICSLNIHNKLQFTGAINILYELAYHNSHKSPSMKNIKERVPASAFPCSP